MWRKMIILGVIIGICGFIPQRVSAQTSPLTINDCIQIAIKNNSNLKNSRRRVDIAGSNITSARATIMPSLNASFTPSRRFQSEAGPYLQDVPVQDPQTGQVTYVQQESFRAQSTNSFFSSSFSVSQTIFDGGRWWNQIF